MADVVRYVDVERLVEYRRARKALWWIRGTVIRGYGRVTVV